MRSLKPPKAPKPPKPVKVKPIKLGKPPKQVKPKLPHQGKQPKQPAPAGAQKTPAGLPVPNCTYDSYPAASPPPGNNPTIAASPAHLEAEFEMATQHSQLDPVFRWTHRLYVQDTDAISDTWPAAPANLVYIPGNGAVNDPTMSTPFKVVFVEVLNRNTPQQYKRVFLYRETPPWPTDYT